MLLHNLRKHDKRNHQDRDMALEMCGITKRFPGVVANDNVSFQLKKGEIHALLGENGAGKTTLMKIAYGLYQPDAGEIFVNGKKVVLRSPQDAVALGIGMVHQHPMLVRPFTTTENIILGLRSSRGPFLGAQEAEVRILELSKEYNLQVNPKARIYELSMGERQRVDILKTLYRNARILILDEPTSVLTPTEIDQLMVMLQRMAHKFGASIVFITHKLPQVMKISDRVTILRKGKVIDSLNTEDTNEKDLACKMVGREIVFDLQKEQLKAGPPVLETVNLKTNDDKGLPAVKGISLTVQKGEILGIAGVAGNGQKELVEVLTGLRKATDGRVFIMGADMTNASPRDLRHQGITYVPADRIGRGSLGEFSVEENLILGDHFSEPYAYRWFLPFRANWFLDRRAVGEHAEELISRFNVKTPSRATPASSLSGGNLQKLILARELSRMPAVLICEEPTQGLDVGAVEYVHLALLKERKRGVAILLISSDLDEVMCLSDRIAVVFEGEIVGTLDGAESNIQVIGQLMTGSAESAASTILKVGSLTHSHLET